MALSALGGDLRGRQHHDATPIRPLCGWDFEVENGQVLDKWHLQSHAFFLMTCGFHVESEGRRLRLSAPSTNIAAT